MNIEDNNQKPTRKQIQITNNSLLKGTIIEVTKCGMPNSFNANIQELQKSDGDIIPHLYNIVTTENNDRII